MTVCYWSHGPFIAETPMMAIFHSELLVYPRVTRGLSCKKKLKAIHWNMGKWWTEFGVPHVQTPHAPTSSPSSPSSRGFIIFYEKMPQIFRQRGWSRKEDVRCRFDLSTTIELGNPLWWYLARAVFFGANETWDIAFLWWETTCLS